jgi:hypothetical protein
VHFAPGEQLRHSGALNVADLVMFTFLKFNISHHIHHLSLGDEFPVRDLIFCVGKGVGAFFGGVVCVGGWLVCLFGGMRGWMGGRSLGLSHCLTDLTD